MYKRIIWMSLFFKFESIVFDIVRGMWLIRYSLLHCRTVSVSLTCCRFRIISLKPLLHHRLRSLHRDWPALACQSVLEFVEVNEELWPCDLCQIHKTPLLLLTRKYRSLSVVIFILAKSCFAFVKDSYVVDRYTEKIEIFQHSLGSHINMWKYC